nr:uncharacterized protein LOC117221851 [Megalopta genalis]
MVNSNKYQPLHAGCGIPVPRAVQLKRAVVNVNSNDDACFYWAVVTLHLPSRKWEKHTNLLFLQDTINLRNHYVSIRNLSRLVSFQLSTRHHKYICDRCLQYFRSQEKLDIRVVDCGRMNECALILPTEDDKWLKFKNHAYKEPAPFVIYADLECLLEKQEDQGHGTCRRYQHHRAFSVGYYLHCRYDSSVCEYRTYRNEKDCIAWFASEFYKLSRKLQPAFDRTVPMATMTAAQISEFHTATHCYVCEEPFGDRDVRVRDHCHFTAAHHGPAHNNCN